MPISQVFTTISKALLKSGKAKIGEEANLIFNKFETI